MADSTDDICPDCWGENPECDVCGGQKSEVKPIKKEDKKETVAVEQPLEPFSLVG